MNLLANRQKGITSMGGLFRKVKGKSRLTTVYRVMHKHHKHVVLHCKRPAATRLNMGVAIELYSIGQNN